MIDTQKGDLTTNELLVLQSELRNAEKSLGLAYLMLLGGHLGLHRFYLRRFGTGSIQLALFVIAMVSYFLLAILSMNLVESNAVIVFAVLFVALPGIALFIWVVVDLFLLGGMVREWNSRVERQLIHQIIELRSMKHE